MYTDVTSILHVRGLALVCIILFLNCVFYDNVPFSGRYPYRFWFHVPRLPIDSRRRKIPSESEAESKVLPPPYKKTKYNPRAMSRPAITEKTIRFRRMA